MTDKDHNSSLSDAIKDLYYALRLLDGSTNDTDDEAAKIAVDSACARVDEVFETRIKDA